MAGGGGGHWGRGPRKPKDARTALKRSVQWAKPLMPLISVGLVCTFVGVYLSQQPPRIFAYTIDTVIGGKHFSVLPRVIALYVGIVIVSQLISSVSGYWMSVAGQRLLHTLRVTIYDHFQLLPLSYFDNRMVGDLTSRATHDVNHLEGMIVNTSNSLVSQVFGIGFALWYMAGYSWQLTLLVAIPVPIIGVSLFLFTRRVKLVYRSIRESTGDFNAKLTENLSGIRVIKAFNREKHEHDLINETSNFLLNQNNKASMMTSVFYPAIQTITTLGQVMVLGVGAYLISKDAFTVGKLTAFTMFVNSFYRPIGDFVRTFDSVQRALASGERIFEVLDYKPEIEDPADPIPLPEVRGEVEFRKVYFRYATGEEVLHDVNVLAKPGQRVALVGHSGAGKSSFINLIGRFYDVTDGCVMVDGNDVRSLRQADLRSHIAMVLQETFLFNGTVRENLLFGKPDATDEEVVAASKAANAHEFVERLEFGYETQIGERGVKLSGGQKQRLAIARAVLADPKILILDEATSSVDSESEFLIHQALDSLMVGRTTFIIAHRLSTVRSADKIIVLEDGNIVEHGDHEELVDADGQYARMYRQQYWLDDEDQDGADGAEMESSI